MLIRIHQVSRNRQTLLYLVFQGGSLRSASRLLLAALVSVSFCQSLPAIRWIHEIDNSGVDSFTGIGADAQGNTYVAGSTLSPNLPVTAAVQSQMASAGVYRVGGPGAAYSLVGSHQCSVRSRGRSRQPERSLRRVPWRKRCRIGAGRQERRRWEYLDRAVDAEFCDSKLRGGPFKRPERIRRRIRYWISQKHGSGEHLGGNRQRDKRMFRL